MKKSVILILLFAVALFNFAYPAISQASNNGDIAINYVKNIKYAYFPLGDEQFFRKEIKKCTLVSQVLPNGKPFSTTIMLQPGQRIAGQISAPSQQEWGYLFYGNDRGLVTLFKSVASSKPQFDQNGQLTNLEITGEGLNGGVFTLTRSNFHYDSSGRIIAYQAVLNSIQEGPWALFQAYNIHYGSNGRITDLDFRDGPPNGPYAEFLHLHNIIYTNDGDIVGWSLKDNSGSSVPYPSGSI